jgi:hypothetical protein
MAQGLTADRPLADRLTDVCRATTELLGCDRSSIFLLEAGSYRAKHNHGNPPDITVRFAGHRVRPDDPLVAGAMRTWSFVIVVVDLIRVADGLRSLLGGLLPADVELETSLAPGLAAPAGGLPLPHAEEGTPR